MATSTTVGTNTQSGKDAEHVFNNAVASLSSAQPPTKATVDQWLKSFRRGKFSDIKYPPTNVGNNTDPLYEHLNRTRDIANYIHHNSVSGKDFYYTSAVDALHFYTSQDYRTSNWWYRQIGLATIAAESLVLLVGKFPSAPLNDCVSYLQKTTNTSMGQLGANQADFAYIQLCWSISGWKNANQPSFLNYTHSASEATSSLCFPVTRHGKEHGEGISADNSFSQHNPQSGVYSQLYAGSYGTVLLGDIFKTQAILYGVFSLSDDALKSLENFVINGMGWFSYAQLYDFQVCGRAISRGMRESSALATWCQQLLDGNPVHPEILQELIRRANGDEANNSYYLGNRAYWVNDYMAHIAEKYCLWAKAISTRTVGTESGNGENLKGYYMGCGSYFISRSGDEYFNIQPVWEWLRIPGTTVEQIANFSYPLIDWGANEWGSNDFAGAISDGDIGITSMILTRKNIKNAKKSVIALKDKSVFIGSSIDISQTSNPVYTSVNQCILNGDVTLYYHDGSQEKLALGGKKTANNIIQVTHDGLRYDFPTPQTITVAAITQKGSWQAINKGESKDIISQNVFSIWIEHPKGSSANYYYEITNIENTTSASQTQPTYTDSAHIVTNREKTTAAAVIFATNNTAVSLTNVTIQALSPIAFIATAKDDGTVELTIADLSQKLTTVDFRFTWGNITSSRTFTLPSGDNSGKSVSYSVSAA